MSSPRPWNDEDPDPSLSSVFQFIKTETEVIIKPCGGVDPAQHFVLDVCTKYNTTTSSVGGVATLSLQPPPGNFSGTIVDCTEHDNCAPPHPEAKPRQGAKADGAIWMYQFLACDAASQRAPLVAWKVNAGRCTLFPTDEGYTGCRGSSCQWFSQGCTIGCEKCSERNDDFFDNLCGSTKAPTLPDEFRTWNLDGSILPPPGVSHDWTAAHPWRSPGDAPVLDACGVAGGSSRDNSAAGGIPPPPHRAGDKGSVVLKSTGTTTWKVGAVMEVAWSIAANHGGGYQYRLCPKDRELTEDCFQQTPLPFASKVQKLRWPNGTEVETPAALVSEGTTPAGSTWAKNPIPACKSMSGGFQEDGCDEPQFPPPAGCNSLCWGYQPSGKVPDRAIPAIVDTLRLPAHVAPGHYVLGFRWDCEQTPQIWQSCSDIEVVADSIII